MILPPFQVICLEIVCRTEGCVGGAVHKEGLVGAAGLVGQFVHRVSVAAVNSHHLHIRHTEPEGAYYVLLDISEFGYESDLRFCEDLAEKVGVGAVPGSSFFREPVNHLIRFHFAKKDETLNAALNRLEQLRRLIPPKARICLD